jgi:hypothetical protein
MAQIHPAPAVDAQTVADAHKTWHYFTKGALYGTVVTVVILLILFFTLV